MSGRSTHQFTENIGTGSSCGSCCSKPASFLANSLNVDTRVNVMRGKTRAACCFPTPFALTDFYGVTGPSANFSTDPNHPSVTQTPLPLSALNDGAVFRIESFVTTNRGGFRDFSFLGGSSVFPDNGAQENVEAPFDVVVLRGDAMASSGLITNNDSFIIDTPILTLSDESAFGSLDAVFREVFKTFNGVHHPQQIGRSIGNNSTFLVLTNPNEFEFGTPNVLQIIWPENIDWTIQFVAPNNRRYTYSAVSRKNTPDGITRCSVQETDLNVDPNTTVQLETFQCTQAWAVPCDAIEYITTRHGVNFEFPGLTGCTGIVSGILEVESMSVEGVNILLKRECMTSAFENHTGAGIVRSDSGPEANGERLAILLNRAFKGHLKTRGWQAFADLQSDHIRIVHPDNTLYFEISVRKRYFKADGTECSQCSDRFILRQGGQVLYIAPNESFETLTTTNNLNIMNGSNWSSESDMNGCFLLDV